ncbi:hypothetical protein [Kitasatospora viridis]|uniref:Uncharacterized protein n=1 Tax=Kitasatospora viridis TaxID=281105 RepID=A0A561T6L1_9ACTN|nr:hypothetical protein [Kitasatospora viridis]TWF82737.1 hypothetical protein FHX73_14219 [Kitasatospora viridis]
MARNRPAAVRAGLPRAHRAGATSQVIDGLSARTLAEIARLERDRSYLHPGEVAESVRLWAEYARRPARQLWQDHEQGNTDWYCCGDPIHARGVLTVVLRALSRQGAREFRRVVSRCDAHWPLPEWADLSP